MFIELTQKDNNKKEIINANVIHYLVATEDGGVEIDFVGCKKYRDVYLEDYSKVKSLLKAKTVGDKNYF